VAKSLQSKCNEALFMKKLIFGAGVYFEFIGNTPPTTDEEELCWIAEAGFDGTFIGWDESEMKKRAQAISNYGLYLQSVHAPFNNMNVLWEENETADLEVKRLCRCVCECAENGVPLVVMHTGRIIGKEPSLIGLNRFEKIVREAEKSGVVIALENTVRLEYLEALFRHFKGNKNVDFCFDTGHQHAYTTNEDVLGKFGKPLCLHLCDNFGKLLEPSHYYDDAHMLPFDGTYDWKGFANKLKALGYDGDITLEILGVNRPSRNTHDIYKNLSYKEFLFRGYESAKKIRSMIES
jgi:sugar phosphate isomerase/epimerase